MVEDADDFPNLWGVITCADWMRNPVSRQEKRLARFLELNRESIRLVDVEHEGDVSKELTAINAQLEDYLDLVESENWCLLDNSGTKHYILCPIIRHNDEIVWRWNHGR